MSNILIINAKKEFGHSQGQLNQTLSQFAYDFLNDSKHQIQITNIDLGYEINEEVEKFLWADTIIYQMPAWWMGEPWILKKYIDEVFTAGHGKLYMSDGRSRKDSSKKYGSGGLLHDKKYMLSVTWNAPIQAFTDPDDFFNAAGVDNVYLPFHKANQFLGMTPLATFMCNDVIKEPNVEAELQRYKTHLNQIFNTH